MPIVRLKIDSMCTTRMRKNLTATQLWVVPEVWALYGRSGERFFTGVVCQGNKVIRRQWTTRDNIKCREGGHFQNCRSHVWTRFVSFWSSAPVTTYST